MIEPPSQTRIRAPRRQRDLRIRRTVAFSVSLGIGLLLAFQGGGYDLVARHEVALVVWALIAFGFGTDLLPRSQLAKGIAPLIALGVLATVTLLAFGWTGSDERTYEEFARVLGYAGFVVLTYCSISRYTSRAAAAGVLAAALIVPLFSLLSRLAPDLITDRTADVLAIDRLSYPLGYWNALACWAAMAIAAGLVWAAHARAMLTRSLVMAALPFAVLTLYLTYSRAGAIAVGVAVLAATALSRRRFSVAVQAAAVAIAGGFAVLVARGEPEIARATGSDGAGAVVVALFVGAALCAVAPVACERLRIDGFRLPSRSARMAVTVAGIAALFLVLTIGRGPIEDGWDEFRNDETATRSSDPAARLTSLGGTRYDIWSSAIDAFESDKGHGLGPGTFEFWWAAEGPNAEFVRDSHSLYLETLAELGVFGLISLLAALGLLLMVALRSRSRLDRTADFGAASAMIAAFVVFLVYGAVDWVWEVPAIVYLAFAGIAAAGASGFDRWSGEMRTAFRVAATAGALLAFAVQIPGLTATEKVRESADQLALGDTPEALRLADQAIDAEPWAATPYAQRALAFEAGGRLEDARASLETAAEKEPSNFRNHLLMARIAARAGDPDEMNRQIAVARGLSPRSIFLAPGAPFLVELNGLLSASR